jgi:hypothetical protein
MLVAERCEKIVGLVNQRGGISKLTLYRIAIVSREHNKFNHFTCTIQVVKDRNIESFTVLFKGLKKAK